MYGFNPFNQISISFFDVSNIFYDNIWVVYIVWHIFVWMLSQILSWNVFETSNKVNKNWLKWLNQSYLKVEGLNWVKVLKMD